MGELNELIRGGVALAHSIIRDLEGDIRFARWRRQDSKGIAYYGRTVSGVVLEDTNPWGPQIYETVPAVVEYRQEFREMAPGHGQISFAHLIILEPVEANGAPLRQQEPFDVRDKIVLPSGETGPIVDIKGFMNADTTRPFFGELWLGKLERGRGGMA